MSSKNHQHQPSGRPRTQQNDTSAHTDQDKIIKTMAQSFGSKFHSSQKKSSNKNPEDEGNELEIERKSDPFTDQFDIAISKKLEKILCNEQIEKILDEIEEIEDDELLQKVKGRSKELMELR